MPWLPLTLKLVNRFTTYGTGARRPPERQGTRWGRGSREPSAGAGSCTTRLSNTHGTAERRILYEFHPWHGREVAIDQVFAKGGVSVAHCRLAGRARGPRLEVPLWMFDRQSCSTVRRRERPHVDLAALEALADLLAAAVRGDGGASVFPSATPSVVSDRQADLRFCDRSQGADHAPVPPPPPGKPIQLDLFGPSNDSRPLDAPRWLGLLDRTRRRATVLMARMLLEHRGGQAEEAETGTGGESGDV